MRLACVRMGLLISVLVAAAACTDNEPPTAAVHTVSGFVSSAVPSEAHVAAIIWEVSSGSPDYVYKFGEGTVTGDRFSITLAGDPPAEAINSYGLGVGLVAVLMPGITLPEGRIAAGIAAADVLAGVSPRHSVIWRVETFDFGGATPPADFWPLVFSPGLSCGACTPAPDGGSFEGFAPTACDGIQVTAFGTAETCDWT